MSLAPDHLEALRGGDSSRALGGPYIHRPCCNRLGISSHLRPHSVGSGVTGDFRDVVSLFVGLPGNEDLRDTFHGLWMLALLAVALWEISGGIRRLDQT